MDNEYAHVMEEQDISDAWQKLEHEKETSIKAIRLFNQPLTKSSIKHMAEAAVIGVLAEGNPLQVAEGLSAMESFIKEVKDTAEFKNYVREEAGKYKGGYTSTSGAKIECCEVGSSYDFSKCGDPTLVELEEKLKSITEDVKARKDFLKPVPLSGLDIITSDGEAVKVFPPSKTSSSSFKVTLAR